MNQDQILSGLQTLFDRIFLDPVKVSPALSAKDVPEWDSLLQISLIVAVEKHFGIRFRVGEVETTHNVGEFADLIGRRLRER
jgi:acyl carrier protein